MTDFQKPAVPAFNPSETYTLAGRGVVRGSDDAHIPADESNSDFREYLAWCASGRELSPAPAPIFNPEDVFAECKRRILAVASTNAQLNMAAARADGDLSDADAATFRAGRRWIDAMRAACASVIASEDKTFADDVHWPELPPGVANLAARF